jgi:hypothetical protein
VESRDIIRDTSTEIKCYDAYSPVFQQQTYVSVNNYICFRLTSQYFISSNNLGARKGKPKSNVVSVGLDASSRELNIKHETKKWLWMERTWKETVVPYTIYNILGHPEWEADVLTTTPLQRCVLCSVGCFCTTHVKERFLIGKLKVQSLCPKGTLVTNYCINFSALTMPL